MLILPEALSMAITSLRNTPQLKARYHTTTKVRDISFAPALHFLFVERLDHFAAQIVNGFHIRRLECNLARFHALCSEAQAQAGLSITVIVKAAHKHWAKHYISSAVHTAPVAGRSI